MYLSFTELYGYARSSLDMSCLNSSNFHHNPVMTPNLPKWHRGVAVELLPSLTQLIKGGVRIQT